VTVPTVASVTALLETIPDPEMPIGIVDLGLIESVRLEPGPGGVLVSIDVLPTFVGCPALPMIEEEIRRKVAALEGVRGVEVRFLNDPPWSVDRISDSGRASLRAHGVAVPGAGEQARSLVELRVTAAPCPFCGSASTRLDSPFGPTRCRNIWYCDRCGNSFERMRKV
jgi:ring-1,2-phenylacetyl-CoA epoxidase subunit PaaD